MPAYIDNQPDKPEFNPRTYVTDDPTLSLVIAVVKLLGGRDVTPFEVETAVFQSQKSVRDYRRS